MTSVSAACKHGVQEVSCDQCEDSLNELLNRRERELKVAKADLNDTLDLLLCTLPILEMDKHWRSVIKRVRDELERHGRLGLATK